MDALKKEPYIFYTRPSHRERHHTDMSRGLPYHHVARLCRGTGHIVLVSGEELHLSAGDVFYFPMGMRYHSYWYGDETDSEHRVEWDSVGFTIFPDEMGRCYAPQILTVDKATRAWLNSLMAPLTDPLTRSGYLYLVLGSLLPHMVETQTDGNQRMIALARKYMTQHPGCTVASLAAACGMSESSLYSLFRKHSSVSIREMRNQIRIEQAVGLLTTTDLSVEEIARRLEFSSAAYFRVVFREVTGKKPRDVRREESGRRML